MSNIANPLCPNCGAALPPRGASSVYQCSYCQRSFEIGPSPSAPTAPLAERTTSPEFPALVAEAERLMVEVVRGHDALAAQAAALGGLAVTLQAAATKKMQQRFATTRKAIAEREEATLGECVEKLTLLQNLTANPVR